MPAEDVEVVLARWESLGTAADVHSIDECAEGLRRAVGGRDDRVATRLIGIFESETQASHSALAAILLACEVANKESAERIVERFKRSMDIRLEAAEDEVSDGEDRRFVRYREPWVYERFVAKGAEHLLAPLDDHAGLFQYCAQRAKRRTFSRTTEDLFKVHKDCTRIMAACDVPDRMRATAVVNWLATQRPIGSGRHMWTLLQSLEPAGALPQVRELLRQNTSPRRVSHSALGVLSHLGDEAILPDLEAMLPAWRSAGDSFEKRVLGHIWQIRIQHPPEQLLGFIASTERPPHVFQRGWALRRAFEHGIDARRIRDALLEHARKSPDSPELVELRRIGLRHGILEPGEVPKRGCN